MKTDPLDQPTTKRDLLQYPSKEDLKNELKNHPTNDEFSKRLNISLKALRLEMEIMFKLQDEKWERRFVAFESRMITLIDPLLKELETRQHDREISASQYADHEMRITKLEQKMTPTST